MRILIVEDEKISRLQLTRIAKGYGRCDIAEDGESAIEYIKKSFKTKRLYDIVFLDIVLPKISGHIVLQVIRAYEHDVGIAREDMTKVYMTTGLKDSNNIKKAYSNMVDGYLVKPLIKEKIEELFKKNKE